MIKWHWTHEFIYACFTPISLGFELPKGPKNCIYCIWFPKINCLLLKDGPGVEARMENTVKGGQYCIEKVWTIVIVYHY